MIGGLNTIFDDTTTSLGMVMYWVLGSLFICFRFMGLINFIYYYITTAFSTFQV